MLSKTVDFNPNSSTSAHLLVNQMNSSFSNVNGKLYKRSSGIRLVLQLLKHNYLLAHHSDNYSW